MPWARIGPRLRRSGQWARVECESVPSLRENGLDEEQAALAAEAIRKALIAAGESFITEMVFPIRWARSCGCSSTGSRWLPIPIPHVAEDDRSIALAGALALLCRQRRNADV